MCVKLSIIMIEYHLIKIKLVFALFIFVKLNFKHMNTQN